MTQSAIVPAAAPDMGFDPISIQDRQAFHDHGYICVRQALTPEHVAELIEVTDRVYDARVAAGAIARGDRLHELGAVARDVAFARLLDHGPTFRHVWGLLGWNIFSHHSHLDVNPPCDRTAEPPTWRWHQDGYRQNSDAEVDTQLNGDPIPRPMFSVKVAFALTDLSQPGRGNTLFVPGSHRDNEFRCTAITGGAYERPQGCRELLAAPGDALVFDRRLWHSRSPNRSPLTRKMLFIGFTYRWIRALDDIRADQTSPVWSGLNPLQRQLLGAPSRATFGFWGVDRSGRVDDDIPLRRQLRERDLLDRSVPWLR